MANDPNTPTPQNPPPPPPTTPAAGGTGPERTPSKGAKVSLVSAKGELIPAEITKVHKNGLVDLTFEQAGQDVQITASPFDVQGKKSDCWCWPDAQNG
jgi:hypothetical protein